MYWEDFGKSVLWALIHLFILWFIVAIYTNIITTASPEQYIWLQTSFAIGIFLYVTFVVLLDRIHRHIKDITQSMESINESLENIQGSVEAQEEDDSDD